MSWLCGVKLVTLVLFAFAHGWAMFVIGYLKGKRAEGKRLRRRLMLAGSRFANDNDD